MPKIECSNLSFNYYDKKGREISRVLKGLNVVFDDKKINVLIGSSGSGKSTLMHILCGLNENYEGTVRFDGTDARELSIRRRKISYITQEFTLYPNLTIFDNIASPLKYDYDIDPSEIKVRVRNIAKALKIEHCLSRKPKHLSYGQQQRVAIAKAFVKDPEVILIDEAFKGLDNATKDDLIFFVKDWKKELNATLIVITHDYRELLTLADKVYVLEDGEIKATIDKNKIKNSKNEAIVSLKAASVLEEIK